MQVTYHTGMYCEEGEPRTPPILTMTNTITPFYVYLRCRLNPGKGAIEERIYFDVMNVITRYPGVLPCFPKGTPAGGTLGNKISPGGDVRLGYY